MKRDNLKNISFGGSLAAVLLITVAIVSGCRENAKPVNKDLIVGKVWEMTKLGGNDLNMSNYPDGAPTINFTADGRISGKTGCNTYHGSYELDGDSITLDLGAMTKMFCIEPGEIEFTMAVVVINKMKFIDGSLVMMNGEKEVMEFRSE